MPDVSVILSVFNGERYLRESIVSILNQTYMDFEFIIINDGSTDNTSEIIKSFKDHRLIIINNKLNQGLTKSLNIGMNIAKGEFIARMDSDDIAHPRRFEKQIIYLKEHLDVVVLGTQSHIINEKSELISSPLSWQKPLTDLSIKWVCMFDSPFIHSSVMIRSKVIKEKLLGYNEDYRTSQDYELWSRIVFDNTCANLEEKLLFFRFHSNSISKNYNGGSLKSISTIMSDASYKCIGRPFSALFVEKWVNIMNIRQRYPQSELFDIKKTINEYFNSFKIKYDVDSLDNDLCFQKNLLFIRLANNYSKLGIIRTYLIVLSKHWKIVSRYLYGFSIIKFKKIFSLNLNIDVC